MTEIDERVAMLRDELGKDIRHYLIHARLNYWGTLILGGVIVISSAATSILALGFDVDHRLLGVLALVPGIALLIGSQFDLQTKCTWHYRKTDALKELLRNLNFQTSIPPTQPEIAAIGEAYDRLDEQMTREWVSAVQQAARDARRDGANAAKGRRAQRRAAQG